MLDQDFCEFLEYKIGEAFENSKDERVRGFWCDGVLLPPFEKFYSKKFVNDNRKVVMMTAFIGKEGQEEYELILDFGRKALSRYERGLNIVECVPNPQNDNWFDIDI